MLEPRLSSTSAPRARARASLRSPTAATWTYSRTWRWTWTRRDGICSSTVSPTSSDIQTLTPTTSHAVSSTCLQRLTRRLSKSRSQGKIMEIYTVQNLELTFQMLNSLVLLFIRSSDVKPTIILKFTPNKATHQQTFHEKLYFCFE